MGRRRKSGSVAASEGLSLRGTQAGPGRPWGRLEGADGWAGLSEAAELLGIPLARVRNWWYRGRLGARRDFKTNRPLVNLRQVANLQAASRSEVASRDRVEDDSERYYDPRESRRCRYRDGSDGTGWCTCWRCGSGRDPVRRADVLRNQHEEGKRR
jgi:hypothetical protein